MTTDKNGVWTREAAWEWYNSRPWIRGCNFMSSDCCNRVDQWQELGFEKRFETTERELDLAASIGFNSIRIIIEYAVWDGEHDSFLRRFDRYLEAAYKRGITAMIVTGNDCCVPKALYKPKTLGPQHVDKGYHGGVKISPHDRYNGELSWNMLDDPDIEKRYYSLLRELLTLYRDDERVICWNLYNEPGNNRADLSMNYMVNMFDIAREVGVKAPLCADVWRGFENGRARSNIEQRALELSDIISYHNYGSYEENIIQLAEIKKLGRPALNTEWLHRIQHNTIEQLYPLFWLENVGNYCWGLVAGEYQTYEPWEALWKRAEEHPELFDITKWQHDLFRPSLRPYDPREIAIIKKFNALADKAGSKGI